ncbi:MAG: hypothetical protein K8M05_07835 [Deltaproteobacteria bacterium]|nr:hypothetical protein [Kofleriaceae bacterium]
MKTLGTALLLVVAACTDRAEFRPAAPTTQGHGGQAAASYDIRMGPGDDPHAQVNVWSRGATVEDGQTVVGVGLEIRNTGDQLVELRTDELQLDAFSNRGAPLPAPQLTWVGSETESVVVPPGEASRMVLEFALPVELDPDHIGSMRLRWVVDHDDGQRYVQFTEFQRVQDEYQTAVVYYDPIWSLYDPFLYGPPYLHHRSYHVPVRRIYVRDHDRHDRYERPRVRDHRR